MPELGFKIQPGSEDEDDLPLMAIRTLSRQASNQPITTLATRLVEASSITSPLTWKWQKPSLR